jgi:hypothetical protein
MWDVQLQCCSSATVQCSEVQCSAVQFSAVHTPKWSRNGAEFGDESPRPRRSPSPRRGPRPQRSARPQRNAATLGPPGGEEGVRGRRRKGRRGRRERSGRRGGRGGRGGSRGKRVRRRGRRERIPAFSSPFSLYLIHYPPSTSPPPLHYTALYRSVHCTGVHCTDVHCAALLTECNALLQHTVSTAHCISCHVLVRRHASGIRASYHTQVSGVSRL